MIELEWDPEVETPATIAIIGGGPVGLESGDLWPVSGIFRVDFRAATRGSSNVGLA